MAAPPVTVVRVVAEDLPLASMTDNEKSKFARLSALYGTNLVAVDVLPNMSPVENQYPSGVAYAFKAESPAFTSPFHPTMFQTAGTAVFPLVRGTLPSTVKEIEEAKDKIKKLFAEPRTGNSLSLAKRDPLTNADKAGSSYIGVLAPNTDAEISLVRGTIYAEEENVAATREFIVVSASLPEVSRDLYQKILDRQKALPSKDTSTPPEIYTLNRSQSTTLSMKELIAMPEMIYAEDAGRRNRAALAAEVAHTLGLDIDLREDTAAGKPGVFIGNPLSDFATYSLQAQADGKIVYYADAIDTAKVRGYVPIKLAPTMGTLLIQGRCDASHPVGTGWSNQWSNAYPASVGRRISVLEAYANVANSLDRMPMIQSFCWSGALPFNDKLHPLTFNTRNSRFKAAEAALGRDHKCTEIHLATVVGYLSGTSESVAGIRSA